MQIWTGGMHSHVHAPLDGHVCCSLLALQAQVYCWSVFEQKVHHWDDTKTAARLALTHLEAPSLLRTARQDAVWRAYC